MNGADSPSAGQLIRLLTWLSPAFPTGGFAYSHGLEWAVEAGDVASPSQLVAWISDLVAHGSLWTDCVLLRLACRATDQQALRELAAYGCACAASRERHQETLAQGAAFRRAVAVWHGAPHDGDDADVLWPIPVALGRAMRCEGISEHVAVPAALHAAAAALVSAAVRLVPLGQTDGLRVLAALESVVLQTTLRSQDATLEDIGGMCLRSDIAAMRHETQPTRLFLT